MKALRIIFVSCLLASVGWSDEPKNQRQLLFEDTFERDDLGDQWTIVIPEFSIRDGKLLGHEVPDRGHGSVIRAPLEFADFILQFSFQHTDGQVFNIVINDKNCKSVHAGHICRASISGGLVRLADDKEGAMKNEIFELMKDPEKKKDRAKILQGRELRIPNQLSKDEWHQAKLSIIGDKISLVIDDEEIGSLQSPGIAHPTKTDFGFTVIGNEIEFDDVRVWSAR